jgi:hypothetical protein
MLQNKLIRLIYHADERRNRILFKDVREAVLKYKEY